MWFSKSATLLKPFNQQVNDQIGRVLRRLGLPIEQVDQVMRYVALPPLHTYRVKLYIWKQHHQIILFASIDFRTEKGLLLHQMLTDLLDENYALSHESFVLVPKDDERLFGCRRIVYENELDDEELLNACHSLIARMERMLSRLYSKGLLPTGPEML